ncbi:MAG: glutathione S-transferase family protein [Gammaproteobacteria bacterium]
MSSAADAGLPLLVIGNRNYSSWSLRAWLFAAHAGIAIDTLRLPLDTPEFRRRIGDYSPTGRVPVLIHGTLHVWDSLAICEYLAEAFAVARAWPEDLANRAQARSLACEMHAGFPDLRKELPMNCRARDRRLVPSPAARQDIDRVIAIWEARLGRQGPWLFGEFGIVDAMFAPVGMRFLTYGVTVPAASAAWIDALIALPAMREWLQEARAECEVQAAEEVGMPASPPS